MKFKILFSILCLVLVSSIYNMDEKIRAESPEDILFEGARSLDINLIKNALNKGANINVIEKSRNTALIVSIDTLLLPNQRLIEKLENIIKLLLQNNADPNIKNNIGENALIAAVTSQSQTRCLKNIISLLLEANSDITIKDNWDRTALEYAKLYGFDSIIQILQYEPARRWFNWLKTRSEISKTTPLIPDIANIVAEYLEPEEDYEEYFV